MAMRRIWLISLALIAGAAVAAPTFEQAAAEQATVRMTARDNAIYRIGYLDRQAEELRRQLNGIESERSEIILRLAAEDAATTGTQQ